MTEGVDIWQRYDAKVVQVRELEERLRKLEERLETLAEERDQRANACAVLTQKLTSARLIAERLRKAERTKDGGGDLSNHRLRAEYDRAREVIGCLLTSLSGSWSGREQVWRADSTSGGRLLYALTRGAMASVSMDSFRVDHDWLRRLDLDRLRIELGFDDGGVDLSVEEEFEEEFEVEGLEPAATVSVEDIYDQDDLPPPPTFTSGAREEPPPPLISALEAFEGIEPDAEQTRVMRAPTEPLPTKQGESKRGETTAVRSIPAPFTIGKLVKPT